MKKILLLFFLFPFISSAGDWDLFRLNQTSFYKYHYYWQDLNVSVQIMDSVRQNGLGEVFYFNRNIQYENAGQCYQEMVDTNFFTPSFFMFIDSLESRNDSTFYYESYSTLPFYLLPKAAVGESWTVTSTYGGNDYNQITITCSAKQIETFFGITDSVKTFTMTPNGTSLNQVPVNNFVMKLSKNYGLIEYVPFSLFLYHPAGTNFFSAQLMGIDSSGTTYGFQRPGLQDYFHLNVGDVLMWRHEYHPAMIQYPPWQEFYKDSIIQVFSSADSVVYDVMETKLDTDNIVTQYSRSFRYLKADYNELLKAPTEWIAFQDGPIGYFPIWGFQFPVTIWNYEYWFLKQDSLTLDTISESTFTGGEFGLDTLTCQLLTVTDIYMHFTMNTRMGLTSYCYDNISSDCYTLTGGTIDGLQYGLSNLPVGVNDISENTSVSLYPNPFHSTAILKIGDWGLGIGILHIYNSMGLLIREDKIENHNSYLLHRDGLNDGLYFYELRSPDYSLIGSGKFIVE